MDSMPASSPHSTQSLPPVGLIHPPTPLLLCFSSLSTWLVGDEPQGWLVRGGCRVAGVSSGWGGWSTPLGSPMWGRSSPTSLARVQPPQARHGEVGSSKVPAQNVTSVFQRGAQEGHMVPLGNRSRTVLEVPYKPSSSSYTQFSPLSPCYVPQCRVVSLAPADVESPASCPAPLSGAC